MKAARSRSVRENHNSATPRPSDMLKVLATLASYKRMEILAALFDRPMGVTELASTLRYDVSDVSRQLDSLRQCSLVRAEIRHQVRLQSISEWVETELVGDRLRIGVTTEQGEHASIEGVLDSTTLRCLATGRDDPVRPAKANAAGMVDRSIGDDGGLSAE